MARKRLCLLGLVLGLGLSSLAQDIDREDAERRLRDARRYLLKEVLHRNGSPLSPHGVVARVGKDPETLRAWVEQNIAYEPYLGAVRGVEGTLAAGAGSDWDRAQLLGALCGAAGHRFRYLPLERTDEEIEAVLALLEAVHEPSAPVETAFEADEVLLRFGVDAASQRAELLASQANRQRLLDEAYDAASLELPALMAALKAGADRRLDHEAWREKLRAGLRQRVLVRIEAAPEVPLSVGPDSEAPSAERLAEVKPVLYPSPELRCVLRLRVKLTSVGADAPTEPTLLLDRTFKPEELINDPLRLEVIPTRGRVSGAPQEWSADEFYQTIAACETFRVLLRHGTRQYKSQFEFDKSGRVFKFKSGPAAAQLGGGLGGMNLGGALTGDEGPASAQDDIQLEALTVELDWNLPGQEPVHSERLIYGRLRQEVSPVFVSDILVAPGPLGEEVVSWLKLEAVEGIASLYDRLRNAGDDPMRFVTNAAVVKMMPELLHDWQLLRQGLLDELLAGEPELGVLRGPLILQKCKWALPDAEKRSIGRRDVLDVVFDGTLCYPRTADAVEAAFRSNLLLGVGSTVLESLLVRETAPWLAGVRGSHARFEAARAAGHTARLCLPGSLDGLTELPARSAWGIAANEPGRAQVFPQAEGAGDWWSVDLATGATIGRGSAGEGQGMTEYTDIHEWQLQTITCFKGFVMANLAPGTVSEGSDPVQDWILCTLGFSATTPTSTYAHLDGGQAAGRWAGMFKIVWSLIGVVQQYQEFE